MQRANCQPGSLSQQTRISSRCHEVSLSPALGRAQLPRSLRTIPSLLEYYRIPRHLQYQRNDFFFSAYERRGSWFVVTKPSFPFLHGEVPDGTRSRPVRGREETRVNCDVASIDVVATVKFGNKLSDRGLLGLRQSQHPSMAFQSAVLGLDRPGLMGQSTQGQFGGPLPGRLIRR
jgi:hypothetical protein